MAINNAVDYCDPSADSCANLSQSWPSVSYTRTIIPDETVGGEEWGGVDAETATDSLGRTTYYTQGNVRTGVDSSGHEVTYQFFRVKRPNSQNYDLIVKFAGLDVVSSVSNDGLLWQYNWTANSNFQVTGVSVADPLSNVWSYTIDPSQDVILTAKDPLNNTTIYTHDSEGRLIKVTSPEGNYVQYALDSRGNTTSTTLVAKPGSGLANIVTSASYPTTCSNPITCNEPTSKTDARGNVTNYTYDPVHGGVLTATAPSVGGVSPQQRYSYTALYAYYKNSAGSIAAASSPVYRLTGSSVCRTLGSCSGTADETKSSTTYGSTGSANNLLPTATAGGAGDGSLSATGSSTYDSVGNRLTVTDALGRVTRYRYDADREVVGVVGPDPDGAGPLKNRAVRTTYNADGLVTLVEKGTVASQSDADWAGFASSQQTSTAYDAADRKIQQNAIAGGVTYAINQFSYDGGGRLDCAAQRMNPSAFSSLPAACTLGTAGNYGPDRIVRSSYDNANKLLKTTTAYGVSGQQRDVATYTYSANGKIKTLADARNNLTTYIYDGFDRLSQTQYPSSTAAGTSNAADYEQLGYDAQGNVTGRRLRGSALPAGSYDIIYGYDVLNRMSSKTLPSPEHAVTYAYDNLGHAKTITGATTLTYGWDALGRETSEAQAYGSVAYQYDLANRRTRLTWQDGTYLTYDYDSADEMADIKENGGTVLASFTYDDLGERKGRTLANGTSRTYGYDPISRLTSLALAGGTNANTATFSNYSPASEVGAQANSNDAFAWTQSANVNRAYTVNGLNQFATIAGAAQVYDGRGNLTSSGGVTYAYTAENRLKSVSGGYTISYDPIGRLQEYDVPTATRFVFDRGQISEEVNASGTVLRRYAFGPGGDEPIVWYEGSGTATKRYIDQDERGSVTRITNQDGTTLAINTYDEFGIPGSSNQGRFGYTGQAWLSEVGLAYYKARVYSPTLGRFLQADPIGYGDGTNRYNYAHSNPIGQTDADGTKAGHINKDGNGVGDGFDPTSGRDLGIGIDETGEMIAGAGRPGQYVGGPNNGADIGKGIGPDDPTFVSTVLQDHGAYVLDANGNLVWDTSIYYNLTVGYTPERLQAAIAVGTIFIPGVGEGAAIPEAGELAESAENLGSFAEESGILRDAAQGKGNFGLGSASEADAANLGESWVGDGYTIASDGKTMVSQDLLRQYRPPSFKPNLGRVQANFEQRWEPFGQWQGNGHLDIVP